MDSCEWRFYNSDVDFYLAILAAREEWDPAFPRNPDNPLDDLLNQVVKIQQTWFECFHSGSSTMVRLQFQMESVPRIRSLLTAIHNEGQEELRMRRSEQNESLYIQEGV